MANKVIMLGNEAIARGAYEAGVKLSSAYPGTQAPKLANILQNTMRFIQSGLQTKR